MDIHNSKKSSSMNQFEIKSCKLNESESRPNITLKKMGQELDIAETKCFTLKSKLNYMMDVCRKAQTEIKGSKGSFDISQESISKNPSLKFPVEDYDCNSEITAVNKTPNYNICQKTHDIKQKTEENFDTSHLRPKSGQFPLRKNIDDDGTQKSKISKEEKQKGLLNVTITPRTQLDKKLPPAIMAIPVQNETTEASREYKNSLSCFSEYMREHFQSMLNEEESVKKLTSKADEDYFQTIPSSAKRDIRDSELNLDIPDIAKARRAEKSKRTSRMERGETNSVCKVGDMISKVRKRKGKLRCSVSKSTITTKDTNIISRKEVKRRKHKGYGVIHQQSTLLEHPKKSNDVVEIFHNTALKNSTSEVSSKHSKFGGQGKYVNKHFTTNQKIQEKLFSERVNNEYQFSNKENQQNHFPQTLNNQNNSGVTPESVQEQNKTEEHSINLYPSVQYKTQYKQTIFNRYNDPTFIPNYEMPTLASKLKQSNRSYFNRFNFRNIPFVVGTSVTPSHNLGLNIQQVLSVMKMRQPVANDIAPLLIRKVSRGMRPVSTILKQINGHCENDVNSQIAEVFNSENPNISQNKNFSVLDLQNVKKTQSARTSNALGSTIINSEKDKNVKQLDKEVDNTYDNKIKQSTSVANKSNVPANTKNQQEISGIPLNKKDDIGDHRIISGSQNSKEIRDILINLHDQFAEMNTKYEKLQSEVEKSNDKSLAKELSSLEKELNAKEDEINAVIVLYKEVMTLKKEMKMLHEKNSLFCIASELAKESRKNHRFPISIIPGKSIDPVQIIGRKKVNNVIREPPASIQLAALLRQIQTFHKQLQLIS